MAIWCPKYEQRKQLEICQKLCPKEWENRLEMEGDWLTCKYEKKSGRILRKRKEKGGE